MMSDHSHQSKRWIEMSPDVAVATSIAQSLNVHLSLAKILVSRGFLQADAAFNFLHPQLRQLTDPFDLPNMEDAINRIFHAIERGERIVVYSDYDVDGLTSSALLIRVLRLIGCDIRSFVPRRLEEGYGLSNRGVERCVRECKPNLLITVDCGTNSVEEIAWLQQSGIDTIVCDHHEIKQVLPKGIAFINPKIVQENAVWTDLASVGVVFKVVHALQKRGREQGFKWAQVLDLREHLDLVAIGTIADIVPLRGENRIMTRVGLQQLATTNKLGLRALKEIAGVPLNLSPYHVGYRIGPRINAAGRLKYAADALELLVTEQSNRAKDLASQLNDWNIERQQIEEQVLRAARQMVEDQVDLSKQRTVVLAAEGWHVGVIGIVAARITQEYYRPTIIIGIQNGVGKGSCRSIPGYSIIDAMTACAPQLEQFGGHAMAAGLTVREENIAELRQRFEQHAGESLIVSELLPSLNVDATIQFAEINEEFLEQLAYFEPCGTKNPTPVFMVKEANVLGMPKIVGKKHIKFRVAAEGITHEAIWFGAGEKTLPTGEIDIAFVPEVNEFRGKKGIQLRVKDIRSSSG